MTELQPHRTSDPHERYQAVCDAANDHDYHDGPVTTRIRRVRRQIADGTYETPAKIDAACEKVARELEGGSDDAQ